ncbi:hypothetical protein AGLY_003692 [Aphis glycines]|uniref:Uncharacterized protein n=1 Tax=Aphis glycines TaxID=307491 RepID=A0A6G0TZF4_APHGL|nr:hypothetical protein AGLY_003692 [Aphis glycines]
MYSLLFRNRFSFRSINVWSALRWLCIRVHTRYIDILHTFFTREPLSGNAADMASNIAILGNGLSSLLFFITIFGVNKLCCSLSSSCYTSSLVLNFFNKRTILIKYLVSHARYILSINYYHEILLNWCPDVHISSPIPSTLDTSDRLDLDAVSMNGRHSQTAFLDNNRLSSSAFFSG